MKKNLTYSLVILLAAMASFQAFGIYRSSNGRLASSSAVIPAVVGEILPEIGIRNMATGKETTLSQTLSDTPLRCKFVYFFDPECPACQSAARSWANRSAITDGAVNVPVLWITLSSDVTGSRSFLQQNSIPVDGFSAGQTDAHRQFGVVSIPTVWGVQGNTIEFIDSGINGTDPTTLPVDWCEESADA